MPKHTSKKKAARKRKMSRADRRKAAIKKLNRKK